MDPTALKTGLICLIYKKGNMNTGGNYREVCLLAMWSRKRKTVIYWKKLLKEANIDWTKAGRMAQDRSAWKEAGMKRVAQMETYEKQQGHHCTWGPNKMRVERSEKTTRDGEQIGDFMCTYPDCGKVCESKGGLRIHQVRMHVKQRKIFTCSKCNASFASENNWKNHEKRCMGVRT